jgi:hypothetical protein
MCTTEVHEVRGERWRLAWTGRAADRSVGGAVWGLIRAAEPVGAGVVVDEAVVVVVAVVLDVVTRVAAW